MTVQQPAAADTSALAHADDGRLDLREERS